MSHRWSLLFAKKDNVQWTPDFDFNKCKKATAWKWTGVYRNTGRIATLLVVTNACRIRSLGDRQSLGQQCPINGRSETHAAGGADDGIQGACSATTGAEAEGQQIN